MLSNSLVSDLISKLLEKFKFNNSAGVVKFEGNTLNGLKLTRLIESLDDIAFLKLTPALKREASRVVLEELINHLPEESISTRYQLLIDIDKRVDVKSNKVKEYLYDKESEKLIEHNPIQFLRTLGKNEVGLIKTTAIPCITVYDPKNVNQVFDLDVGHLLNDLDEPLKAVNLYTAPFWKRLELSNRKLPSVLEAFFSRFIPCEQSRHYLFCWLREAVFGRNATVLVMIGAQGTGKGFLCEMLIPRLVGLENWSKAQVSFVTKEFNAGLQNKTIINIDEIKINAVNSEKMKTYTADRVNIEGKGKDAVDSIPIHSNYIFTNNNWDSLYLTRNDRRYSVIDITDIPTDVNFGIEAWEKIWDYCITNEKTSDKTIYQFGSFLYNYDVSNWNKYKPFKSKSFDRLVLESMNEWQRLIYDMLLSRKKEQYTLEFLKPSKEKPLFYKMPSLNEISDWLKSTTYTDIELGKEVSIGELQRDNLSSGKDRRSYKIIPCNALMPVRGEE